MKKNFNSKSSCKQNTPIRRATTMGRTAQAILVECQRLGLELTGHETPLTLPLPTGLPRTFEISNLKIVATACRIRHAQPTIHTKHRRQKGNFSLLLVVVVYRRFSAITNIIETNLNA
jgi:hypothetical protein